MKLFRFDRYLFLMNVISIMVAFLTHFPELIALLDPDSEQTLFPDMHPGGLFAGDHLDGQ